jgi:flavin reductase (DIM6/NTAB) family NADH-FMN oxidoreductase RutF
VPGPDPDPAGPAAVPEEFDFPVGGGFVTGGPEGIGESHFEEIPEEEALDVAGPDLDPAIEFRRTLGMFATGVTIITTQAGEQVHGMTANAFMSVSIRPPLVLVSVDKRARMHGLLHEGVRYGVNVLADDQNEISDHFAGRARDAPPATRFVVIHGTPLVEGAIAHLVARVVRGYWGGDHSLFLGHVEYARYGEGRPLLFHGGRYEHLPLANVPVFSSLSAPVRERILAAGEERDYEEGAVVVRRGETGHELFVILEGRVRVERDGRTVGELSSGDFFGELAVLDGRPRAADVIATEALRCLVVPRATLREALLREPQSAWDMLEILAGRLRDE